MSPYLLTTDPDKEHISCLSSRFRPRCPETQRAISETDLSSWPMKLCIELQPLSRIFSSRLWPLLCPYLPSLVVKDSIPAWRCDWLGECISRCFLPDIILPHIYLLSQLKPGYSIHPPLLILDTSAVFPFIFVHGDATCETTPSCTLLRWLTIITGLPQSRELLVSKYWSLHPSLSW